jgi:cell division septation protein DedD
MDVSKLEIYNTEPVIQYPPPQSYTQGKTRSYEQGNAQDNTQINTQINAQGNAQVYAQINIQNNTKNSAQSITQSASKPAPAVKKPAPAAKPAVKPAPAKKPAAKVTQPCPPPKTKTYRIQVGAFCNPANANNVVARLQCQNLNPVKEKYQQYTRVVLKGIPANRLDATVAVVKSAGFCETWIQLE